MHPFLSQGSADENITWTKASLKARSFSTKHFPVKIQKDFLIGISSFSLWATGLWNKNTKCLLRKTNLGQILFSFAFGLSLPVTMKGTTVTTTAPC